MYKKSTTYDFESLYCTRFKESCEVCQYRCENGELDCAKCDESIQIESIK